MCCLLQAGLDVRHVYSLRYQTANTTNMLRCLDHAKIGICPARQPGDTKLARLENGGGWSFYGILV